MTVSDSLRMFVEALARRDPSLVKNLSPLVSEVLTLTGKHDVRSTFAVFRSVPFVFLSKHFVAIPIVTRTLDRFKLLTSRIIVPVDSEKKFWVYEEDVDAYAELVTVFGYGKRFGVISSVALFSDVENLLTRLEAEGKVSSVHGLKVAEALDVDIVNLLSKSLRIPMESCIDTDLCVVSDAGNYMVFPGIVLLVFAPSPTVMNSAFEIPLYQVATRSFLASIASRATFILTRRGLEVRADVLPSGTGFDLVVAYPSEEPEILQKIDRVKEIVCSAVAEALNTDVKGLADFFTVNFTVFSFPLELRFRFTATPHLGEHPEYRRIAEMFRDSAEKSLRERRTYAVAYYEKLPIYIRCENCLNPYVTAYADVLGGGGIRYYVSTEIDLLNKLGCIPIDSNSKLVIYTPVFGEAKAVVANFRGSEKRLCVEPKVLDGVKIF